MSWFTEMSALGAEMLYAGAGLTVTRYRLGDSGNSVDVEDATFAEDDPVSTNTDRIRTLIAVSNVRMGTLHVPADQEADPRDAWLINDERWEATNVNTVGPQKLIRVKRVTQELRNQAPPTLI